MFAVPQFVVKFEVQKHEVWNWVVNGEEELDVFCKILRLNGMTDYAVSPRGESPLYLQEREEAK
jgi:hypothetical protein